MWQLLTFQRDSEVVEGQQLEITFSLCRLCEASVTKDWTRKLSSAKSPRKIADCGCAGNPRASDAHCHLARSRPVCEERARGLAAAKSDKVSAFAATLSFYFSYFPSFSRDKMPTVHRINCKSSVGGCWPYGCPAIWNSLLFHLRHASSSSASKQRLQTHLFGCACDWWHVLVGQIIQNLVMIFYKLINCSPSSSLQEISNMCDAVRNLLWCVKKI